jgi:NAD+ synthase (glutamine-hydrolysing)
MLVTLVQLNPIVGDLKGNFEKIKKALEEAKQKKSDIVVFPELAICGYPPEDLLFFPGFIDAVESSLQEVIPLTKGLFVICGTVRKNPEKWGKELFNTAAVIQDGKLLGYKDKTLLPTYDVFDESRYFEAGEKQKVFTFQKKKIGVLICEDMWQHAGEFSKTRYERDPVNELIKLQPDLVINISASPYYFEKRDMRHKIFSPCAHDLQCPVIWCNQVGANDQLVFDGYSMLMDKQGTMRLSAKGFEEDFLSFNPFDQSDKSPKKSDPYDDLQKALIVGVRDYFYKQGFSKAIIGLSGGIDSALVAYIAVKALGKENVHMLAMPSRFTSLESIEDAAKLAKTLGVSILDIPIDHLFQDFLDLFAPHFQDKPLDTTEENIQARIRGIILMAFSNKFGYLVLSTGNKSEMALGYSTLYGDMCGGLGVLNDVTKTQIYKLAAYINQKKEIIPKRILTKAPSAELKADQKDQDSLPSYEIVDQVIEGYIEEAKSNREIAAEHKIDLTLVDELIRKIHLAEYKRRQGPPAINVTKKSFSKGRRFPIVQKWD